MFESKYLKENIENIQKLMAIPALKDFETLNLGRLLRLSKIRIYEDGEHIIEEGADDPWLYFLLKGKVRVAKDNVTISNIETMGEIFGEMRLIDNMGRSTDVIAVGKTVCLAVDTSPQAAKERLSSADGRDEKLDFLLLLYRIFTEYLSMRLRLTNEELIKAKKKLTEAK